MGRLTEWANTNLGPTAHNNQDNEAFTLALNNHIRDLINSAGVYSKGLFDLWGEAYTDANGRNNSIVATSATFDTNKMKAVTSATEPFIIIEASSISSQSDFAINNCYIVRVDTGTWQLSCSTGTDAVKRAQMIKTLFYGSNGTDPRASATYITGLTALKTSVAADVGKRAYYATATIITTSSVQAGTYTGTFADTSTNTNCNAWSYVATDPDGTNYCRFEFASGNIVNNVTSTPPLTSDETGTDTSGDDLSNPANCQIDISNNSSGSGDTSTARVIVLCKGSVSWVVGGTLDSYSKIDFYVDNSVPLFTATTEDFESIISHTIPSGTFAPTCSEAILSTVFTDYEDGCDVQFLLSNGTVNTGWLSCGTAPRVSAFSAFEYEPTILDVKLIPKSSPTSNYPSVRGVAVRVT